MDVAPDIDLEAVTAVVEWLTREVGPRFMVAAISGYTSREDRAWRQLIFSLRSGDGPEDAWRETRAAVSDGMQLLMEKQPRLASAIASQISFEI